MKIIIGMILFSGLSKLPVPELGVFLLPDVQGEPMVACVMFSFALEVDIRCS